jgi:hypothetical protein
MSVALIKYPLLTYPINLHNRPLEHSLIALVARYFGLRESDVGYEGRPQRHPYDAIVVMPFLDGRIGLETAIETNLFITRGLPAFIIVTEHVITLPALRIFEVHPFCGLFILRMITETEANLLRGAHPSLVVPRDETLRRLSRGYDADLMVS